MTLYSKAKAYEKGEKISFGGREFAPLYTPKNDTLINLFQITDDEQAQLRTIISKGMAATRHRERETARRRAAGAVDRESHLAAVQEASAAKREQAQTLRASGLSVRAIAKQMNVSVGAVSGYLKAVQSPVRISGDQADSKGVHSSVRITNGEAHARAVGPAFE